MKTYLKVSGQAGLALLFLKEARPILDMKFITPKFEFLLCVNTPASEACEAIAWFVGGKDVLVVEEISEETWHARMREVGWSIVCVGKPKTSIATAL